MILSVSGSGSVPEIWNLSVGYTDTVSVSVYTTCVNTVIRTIIWHYKCSGIGVKIGSLEGGGG